MIKLSFGSWAFLTGPYSTRPIPLGSVIERLGEAEYDGIELSGFAPHASLVDFATPHSRRRLVRILEDNDLTISGQAMPRISARSIRWLNGTRSATSIGFTVRW